MNSAAVDISVIDSQYQSSLYLKKNFEEDTPQKLNILVGKKIKTHYIASANSTAYKNIKWGRIDTLFTPAYWKAQFLMSETCPQYSIYKLGNSIEEEIAACLLGGHGISADMGLEAYAMILKSGVLEHRKPNDERIHNKIYHILSSPFPMGEKFVKYRYPKQKTEYLFDALNKIWSSDIPDNDIDFRCWLMSIKGIGYKTSSWITRNWLDSDNVAIIDIHIFRAGILMGLFNGDENITKEYLCLEKQLLNISKAIDVKISQLDSIIWHQMRTLNKHVIKLINRKENILIK